MIKFKCTTCAGEYSDHCDDGLEYYHACPSVLVGEEKYAERPDKRDENAGKKSEGKGRSEVK